MRQTLLCLLSLSLLTGATADAKRAFEIADLYKVAGAGVPEISRDGSRAAFSVTRYDLPDQAPRLRSGNRAFGKDGGWTTP